MILYTIVSPEDIFDGESEAPNPNSASNIIDAPTRMNEIEINYKGISLIGEPLEGGQIRITRIISTNPHDYLDPRWQPGEIICSHDFSRKNSLR